MPVITVDGPGGVGKGTLCRALAQKLAWHYLDSGALYRLLAYKLARNNIPQSKAAQAAQDMQIAFSLMDNEVELDGEWVGQHIRTEQAGDMASRIAVIPEVRAALLDRQRAFATGAGLVADGRDMGTVVFPDAPLKIFLDASAEVRARRREKELLEAGKPVIFEKIFREISERDHRDRSRAIAPLQPAADALVLDSSGKDAAEVLQLAWSWASERGLVSAL